MWFDTFGDLNWLAVIVAASPKPVTWFLVTGGYHLVGIVIASAIIGAWQ